MTLKVKIVSLAVIILLEVFEVGYLVGQNKEPQKEIIILAFEEDEVRSF